MAEPAHTEGKTPCPSPTLLRMALGVTYFYFGFLKFFPDLSVAEVLAGHALTNLSSHSMDARSLLLALAVLECAIGLGFLFNVCLPIVTVLFFLHLGGTFLPLLLLPELTFKFFPFAPTLDGQYILKNVVFAAAGWTVLSPELRRRYIPQ